MTKELKTLLQKGYGYRTETFSGSKVRNLKDVLYFELYELFNTDIYSYILNHYKHLLSDNMIEIFTEFLSVGEYDWDDYIDTYLEYKEESMNCIENVCKTLLETDDVSNIKAIWLASYRRVMTLYQGKEDTIDTYSLEKMKVLSDLGEDGSLFIYKEV